MTAIRRAALAAGIAGILGESLPFWNFVQLVLGWRTRWWRFVLIALFGAWAAVFPIFCFALYRNDQPLALSRRHRVLALAAALVPTANFFSVMAELIQRVYLNRRESWTVNASLFVKASPDIVIVLLLLTFWWKTQAEQSSQASMEILRKVSLAAAIVNGLFLIFLFVRLPFLPFAIKQLSDLALRVGRTPPSLVSQLAEGVRLMLVQGCIFVAPFIVWRASRRKASTGQEPPNPETMATKTTEADR